MDNSTYEDPLNHLWEHAALFMLCLDPTGVVRRANPFALRYVTADCFGRPFIELVVDFTQQLDPADIRKWPTTPERVNICTSADMPVTFFMSFLPQSDGILVVGSPDIDGLEKIDKQVLHLNRELSGKGRELHKANAELRALNTLKNQFLGMAAHDLRTPLGAIYNFAQFIRSESDTLSEEHAEFLDIIIDSSEQMRQLIEGFLDVSIIESGKLSVRRERTTVGRLIHTFRDMMVPLSKTKGVELICEVEDPELVIDVDGSKIGQVLINLSKNAIEFSNPGARIWISTFRQADRLTFSVRDEAGGIPPEETQHLFAPFEQAGTYKTGGERSIGLGLTISKKIVEAHNGTLRVESDWGEGSTFLFTLPMTQNYEEGP